MLQCWCASMLTGRSSATEWRLLPDLDVVDEPGFTQARSSQYYQVFGVHGGLAQVRSHTHREVVGLHAGFSEGLDAEALDAGEIHLSRARAAGRCLQRLIDARRDRALDSRQILVAR